VSAESLPVITVDEPTSARRIRFRQAVSGLVSRAESTDLLRWVLLPGAVLLTLGFVLMILGWVGAARTFREIEQIPYLISGGLVGLGLVIVGALLLASAFWMVLLQKFEQEAEERARRNTEALEARLVELTAASAPAPRRSAQRQRPTSRRG
jgi:NADH:ubiquinone oxidoreductase subunit 6 (subunit J)